jgi:hypothetical protein
MISPAVNTTPTTPAPAASAAPAADTSSLSDDIGDFFHNLLEIVNPLQHLPVVSTLYRNLTGDKINTFDKIAGDTLYGGPIGFAGSVADTIFEKVTGKDVGDTVYSFLFGDSSEGSNDPSAPMKIVPYSQLTGLDVSSIHVADADEPAPSQIASAPPRKLGMDAMATPDLSALQAAMLKAQVDPVTASRAAYAYQRAIGLAPDASTGSVNPPLN